MRVLHLNTNRRGGAFHAMARLHLALCELGVDSNAVTRSTPQPLAEKVLRRFETWLCGGKPNVFAPLRNVRPTPLGQLTGEVPDIVHLHWVSRWIDLPSFVASLPSTTPIFITPHDFGVFTGGCHLHVGCEGFAHGCTHCPLVRPPFDNAVPLPARELARKKRVLAGRNVVVVGNSDWTTSYAKRSQVFPGGTRFETVHPSFDTRAFVRQPREAARARFGLDTTRPVLGFGSAALSDENKRLDLFFETAASVAEGHPGLQLLLFGDHHALPPAPAGTTIVHTGPLSEPGDLASVYSAMDVFCITSRVETFGQVSVEAQACGTPVAATEAGGLAETLSPGHTGSLSPAGDSTHLARSIGELLADTGRRQQMGDEAARWVRSRFSAAAAAARTRSLYEEALAR